MTEGVVIVGASGFGRETADVVEAMGVPIIGVIDDSPSEINLERLRDRGLAFLGSTGAWLSEPTHRTQYLIAIGDPRVRALVADKFDSAGHIPFTAIHPSATIGSDSRIGLGSVICAGSRVSTNVTLGRHVHLNPNSVVGHDSYLNDFVSLNPMSNVSGECIIGRQTLIGAGATVLQQLRIGSDVLVGAAALVTRDAPDGVIAKGIPAKWPEPSQSTGT